MAEDKHITGLPRGPWVSEEEIQAILHTDADAEFEQLRRGRRKPLARRLWPVAAAASIAAIVAFAWMGRNDGDETVVYIYGNRVSDEKVALEMMHATLAEALAPATQVENELNNILTP